MRAGFSSWLWNSRQPLLHFQLAPAVSALSILERSREIATAASVLEKGAFGLEGWKLGCAALHSSISDPSASPVRRVFSLQTPACMGPSLAFRGPSGSPLHSHPKPTLLFKECTTPFRSPSPFSVRATHRHSTPLVDSRAFADQQPAPPAPTFAASLQPSKRQFTHSEFPSGCESACATYDASFAVRPHPLRGPLADDSLCSSGLRATW